MMSLVDQYGRTIGSLRISLTDRCNLRCQYCMPEEGITWLDREEILSFEEIITISKIFYQHGVRKYRLTGGEPLIRKDVTTFVRMFKEEFPDTDLAMTTNGIYLEKFAKELYQNGLDRLNISLDTLDHQEFTNLTRRDSFDKVMTGIKTALELGFKEVKINAVSIKSINDDLDTLEKFIEFSDEHNIEVRFIEIMPFTGNHWEDGGFVTSQELRDIIRQEHELVKLPMKNPSSTSRTWKIKDTNAKLGFISSVSESFCSECNRLRLTAEGKLRPCLHNKREYDLKTPLRENQSQKQLLEIIKKGINEKWKAHPDFLSLKYSSPVDDREMIRIGG